MSDPNLGRDLALYTLARIGVVAVVTGLLLVFDVPLLVAVLVAVVVGFPISLLLFRGLNRRVTEGLSARFATKNAERQRLRAELRGDDVP